MISTQLSPFYATISRKAFIYTKRRFITVLGYTTYLLGVFLVWNVISGILHIMYSALREELPYILYPSRTTTPPGDSCHTEKLKKE